MRSDLLTLSRTADPQTQTTCGLTIPNDGIIQWVRVSFPFSKNVVQARIYVNGQQIVPSLGNSLVDNGTVDIPIGQAVREGDHVMLWVGNPDQVPHTVTASLLLENTQQDNVYGTSGAVVEPIQIPESVQGDQGSQPVSPSPPDETGPGMGDGQGTVPVPVSGAQQNAPLPNGAPTGIPGSVPQITRIIPQPPMRPGQRRVPIYPGVYGDVYPQDMGQATTTQGTTNIISVDPTLAMLFIFGLLLIVILLIIVLKDKK